MNLICLLKRLQISSNGNIIYQYVVSVPVQRDVKPVWRQLAERVVGPVQERQVFAYTRR